MVHRAAAVEEENEAKVYRYCTVHPRKDIGRIEQIVRSIAPFIEVQGDLDDSNLICVKASATDVGAVQFKEALQAVTTSFKPPVHLFPALEYKAVVVNSGPDTFTSLEEAEFLKTYVVVKSTGRKIYLTPVSEIPARLFARCLMSADAPQLDGLFFKNFWRDFRRILPGKEIIRLDELDFAPVIKAVREADRVPKKLKAHAQPPGSVTLDMGANQPLRTFGVSRGRADPSVIIGYDSANPFRGRFREATRYEDIRLNLQTNPAAVGKELSAKEYRAHQSALRALEERGLKQIVSVPNTVWSAMWLDPVTGKPVFVYIDFPDIISGAVGAEHEEAVQAPPPPPPRSPHGTVGRVSGEAAEEEGSGSSSESELEAEEEESASSGGEEEAVSEYGSELSEGSESETEGLLEEAEEEEEPRTGGRHARIEREEEMEVVGDDYLPSFNDLTFDEHSLPLSYIRSLPAEWDTIRRACRTNFNDVRSLDKVRNAVVAELGQLAAYALTQSPKELSEHQTALNSTFLQYSIARSEIAE